MTTEPKLSLHRKLATVMYEAERIPKNGTAPKEMGGYPFVQVGDAADYIRKALAEKVITMMPTGVQVVGQHEGTTKSGATIMYVDLITSWTLTDGESGESITIQSFGAGSDMGDKYSGKASTSAMKYALLTGFLLSTGEDSEGSATPVRGGPDASQPTEPNTEDVELLGNIQKTGTTMKGGPELYQGSWRQDISGPATGFKLKLDGDDRDIPQVLVKGDIGRGLSLLLGEDPILKLRVTVKGKLYNVRPSKGGSFYRLVVENAERDFIEGPFGRVPASAELAATEAESEPLFAEPTEAEKAEILARELAEASA